MSLGYFSAGDTVYYIGKSRRLKNTLGGAPGTIMFFYGSDRAYVEWRIYLDYSNTVKLTSLSKECPSD